MRRFHDFAAAEDAAQEASIAAVMQWPQIGIPENPRAWLTQVAVRKMTDHIRVEAARRRRETELAEETARAPAIPFDDTPMKDDTLVLLFMCCHPALSPSSAIALTLRAVGGLTTAEIASAFLVPEATMAQRISRAKQTIKASGIPFQMPESEERGMRLRSVLHVLYLIFNEGYTATSGPHLRRADLSQEGIRLARLALQLEPANTEIAGLLALMLLTDARRHARTGINDELIPLSQQNRALWDRAQIAEGVALLSAALPKGSVGPYQLQAAIAAVHDEAESPRRYRLAPDPSAIRVTETDVGQSHGDLESRDCGRHGSWSERRIDLAGRPPAGAANCRTSPPGRRSRTSAGDVGRFAGRGEILPRGSGQNGKSPGTELSSDASGAALRRASVRHIRCFADRDRCGKRR